MDYALHLSNSSMSVNANEVIMKKFLIPLLMSPSFHASASSFEFQTYGNGVSLFDNGAIAKDGWSQRWKHSLRCVT